MIFTSRLVPFLWGMLGGALSTALVVLLIVLFLYNAILALTENAEAVVDEIHKQTPVRQPRTADSNLRLITQPAGDTG
jgi:hypothetical protein